MDSLSADPIPLSAPLIAAALAALLTGMFTCADTALTSLSSARLGALAMESKPRFRDALDRAVRRRPILQARYLAGRVTSLSITAGALALWLYLQALEVKVTVALAIASILSLAILVELCATIGRRAADSVLPLALLLLRPLELLMAPLGFLTSAFTSVAKWRGQSNPRVDETEVELMVDQREREGAIEQEDAELIRNVLEFTELVARDAMVPRTKVIAIRLGTPLSEVLQTVTESGHSRYPVYREDMDDIFGLLYAKDLFRVLRHSYRAPASDPPISESTPSRPGAVLLDIVREPVKFVSESQPLSAVLAEMRRDRQHLAVVVDEFGGTSGVVTLEDVLEEI
ncbi:MAG: DUF21 domain-containing protein, partial [Myxococcales bacterium]|nr:DUF21 domain-containing protein [Myxococcales bacterium]